MGQFAIEFSAKFSGSKALTGKRTMSPRANRAGASSDGHRIRVIKVTSLSVTKLARRMRAKHPGRSTRRPQLDDRRPDEEIAGRLRTFGPWGVFEGPALTHAAMCAQCPLDRRESDAVIPLLRAMQLPILRLDGGVRRWHLGRLRQTLVLDRKIGRDGTTDHG